MGPLRCILSCFMAKFSVGLPVALSCCCLTNPRTDVLILGGANDAALTSDLIALDPPGGLFSPPPSLLSTSVSACLTASASATLPLPFGFARQGLENK